MMKPQSLLIDSIYVPMKRRTTLNVEKVQVIAESIMEAGLKAPVLVRQDGARFVLSRGIASA